MQFHKTAHQQSSSDEQDQRRRDLGNDQGVAQPPSPGTARSASSALLEESVQIDLQALESRREAEKLTCQQADDNGECQDTPINPDHLQTGKLRRSKRNECANRQLRQ